MTNRTTQRRGWVLYDGDCSFCVALADRFRPLFSRQGFEFDRLQSEWVADKLHTTLDELLRQMWVLTADGRIFGGADAVVYLAKFSGWAWPIRAIANVPGGRTLLRIGYRWIAANRSCAGGVCPVSTEAKWPGWLPLCVLTPLALTAAWTLPPWILMWTLAVAMYVGFKWLTWWDGRKAAVGVSRSIGYLLLWPGMEAKTFLNPNLHPPKAKLREWFIAGLNILLGSTLVWGCVRLLPDNRELLRGWVGMLGMILFLHFGILHLLALFWQKAGVMAQPLMNMPIAAQSLSEFWSKRWNRGFNNIVRQHIFRPLQPHVGLASATLLTFFVSGVIHEVAISIPARGGFGLPTLYFVLQGIGVLFEHSGLGRRLKLKSGLRGWAFTLLITAGPAYWLFPPPFVERVILPFLKTIGAL
ncbi:MAG: DCC1-like thiol-disulfide oxidoreductase family protein [Chthoniobacterales bacterium]